jgi:hypothetical protein
MYHIRNQQTLQPILQNVRCFDETEQFMGRRREDFCVVELGGEVV